MQAFVLTACLLPILASAAANKGLYNNSDHVAILNDRTLAKLLTSKLQQSYYIEFYNRFCGHCINYAPLFKEFAADVKGWNDTVKIAVIDCAEYGKACADKIRAYPSFFFVKRGPPVKNSGQTLVGDTVDMIKRIVIQHLEFETFLKPITKESALEQPEGTVVLSDPEGFISQQVLLDLRYCKKPLFWLFADSGSTVTIMQIVGRKLRPVARGLTSRAAVRDKVAALWDAPVPQEEEEQPSKPNLPKPALDLTKVKNYEARPQFIDIYSSLRMALADDVALLPVITGSNRTSLVNFLTITKEYFSYIKEKSRERSVRKVAAELTVMLEALEKHLRDTTSVTQNQWRALFSSVDKLPKVTVWNHCAGSQSYFRRYPCGLWTLFHSLTVFDYLRGGQTNPSRVLTFIRNFIVNFFSCRECAENFKKEMVRLSSVKSKSAGVLHLWHVHNNVNRRLKGKPSEDPVFPKIQFPSSAECPKCYSDKQLDKDNTAAILDFLIVFYNPALLPLGTGWPKVAYSAVGNNLNGNSAVGAVSSCPILQFVGLLLCAGGGFLARFGL